MSEDIDAAVESEGGAMAEWIFDRHGQPQIIVDGDCFRSADGKVVGWISGNAAFSLSGRRVACYENGVLYDGSSFAIGFRAGATGYLPSRPRLSGSPQGMPGFAGRPRRPDLSRVPGGPGFRGWSHIRLNRFFL